MPIIIGLFVGGFFGVQAGNSFAAMLAGAFAGAVIGWLVERSLRQQREIEALKRALGKPVEAIAAAAAAEPAAQASDEPFEGVGDEAEPEAERPRPPAVLTPPRSLSAADLVGRGTVAATSTVSATQAAARAVPAPTEAVAASPPSGPSVDLLAPLRRWFFGGNMIAKAGVGILFIGLAFLAKYATEHAHVPIELRLAAIGGAAIVLLAIGWRLRTKRPEYAQVLQGGAVAVLYLTLFVAFRFYGVLAVGPVFALMVAVSALAAALAVLQNSMPLAVIGALGGFAAPLLIATGSGNYVALFSYYLVLDLGIAAVAWFRTWRLLNLVGFAATFLVATAWGVLDYRADHYANSQAFLIAFFVLFVAIMLMPARRAQQAPTAAGMTDRWVNGTLLFGLPTIVFVLQYGLVRHVPYGAALSALAMAAFYVLLALGMRARPHLALAFEGSLAVGTVLLTLVIPFALDARATAGAWALEGAGLVWLGLRQARLLPRLFGYALLLLAGGSMLRALDRYGSPQTPFNALLFGGLMLVAGALIAAYFVQRHLRDAKAAASANATALEAAGGPFAPPSKADRAARPRRLAAEAVDQAAQPLLIGWATLWWFVTAWMHIDALVAPAYQLAAVLACVGALALLYTVLAHKLAWPQIAQPVLALTPLLAVGTAHSAISQPGPLAHGGWWAWPLALAVHLLSLRWAAPDWAGAGRHLAHALGLLVLAALGALEGRAITEHWGDVATAWAWLGWLVVPAALLGLLLHRAAPRVWPVREEPSAYLSTAAGVLALGLLLWTLAANVVSSGSAQPLPYVPLINPLDLGIAAALVAATQWLRSAAAPAFVVRDPRLTPALIGGAGFVWLNAMLVRAFHQWGGVPFHVEAWMASPAVQTGITLLWTTTALAMMWLSAKRGLRAPWVVGATLLALVVVKLLVVDLSGSGSVTRIVSFIGVGVLMLVIGYVAPLPKSKASQADKEPAHAQS